jgi:hypothetical protein
MSSNVKPAGFAAVRIWMGPGPFGWPSSITQMTTPKDPAAAGGSDPYEPAITWAGGWLSNGLASLRSS